MEPLDIWGEPVKEKPHRFEWALKILRDGGKVRLPKWLPGCYIRVINGELVYSAGMGTESGPFVLEWHQVASNEWRAA